MLGKQLESKVKFLIWAEKNKGVALAKGFSLILTEMRDMPNKCEDPDDMKSTTDEEKASVKAVNKNTSDIVYLYQEVDTRYARSMPWEWDRFWI